MKQIFTYLFIVLCFTGVDSMAQTVNAVSVHSIEYQTRSNLDDQDSSFSVSIKGDATHNYELSNYHWKSSQLKPVLYFYNTLPPVSIGDPAENDIEFEVFIEIKKVSDGVAVYKYTVPVTDSCLANSDSQGTCGNSKTDIDYVSAKKINGEWNYTEKDYLDSAANDRYFKGLPPGGIVRIELPPFAPIDGDGAFRYVISATARELSGGQKPLDEDYLEDNSISRSIVQLNNLEDPYLMIEMFDLYDMTELGPMPRSTHWINRGAEIVDGRTVSEYPLDLPRPYFPINKDQYPDYSIHHPTLKMDRLDWDDSDWSIKKGKAAGDILTSHLYEIDSNNSSLVLSLGVQRTRKQDSWDRGWSDAMLIGPEPRAILNSDPLNPFNPESSASALPDSLIVEFAFPENILEAVNIPDSNWRKHIRYDRPENAPDRIESEVPAIAIFGGGGYLTAFGKAENSDSIFSKPTEKYAGGLHSNIYDIGIDHGFKRYFVRIPPSILKDSPSDYYRLRMRVAATDDKKCTNCIPDDNDEFYVDNIQLTKGGYEESTDLEMTKVWIKWPYESVPARQGEEIAVKVNVVNNTPTDAPFYFCQVVIYKADIETLYSEWGTIDYFMSQNDPAYCRKLTIPQQLGLTDKTWDFPAFNATDVGEGKFIMVGYAHIPGGDSFDYNDAAISSFTVDFADDIKQDSEINDVPELSGKAGKGLNLYGYSEGGWGNEEGYQDWFEWDTYPYGIQKGLGEGEIAVRFELTASDTLRAYRAYFASEASIDDEVIYTLYKDNDGEPGDSIAGSKIRIAKGFDSESGKQVFDAYSTAKLDDPIALAKGSYWLGVTQLENTALELGASSLNAGQRTLNVSIDLPNGEMGKEGNSFNISETHRIENSRGRLINRYFSIYRNWDGEWIVMSPTIGNTGFPHLPHTGTNAEDRITQTLSQGYWKPMLRPVFKDEYLANPGLEKPCPSWDTNFYRPRIPWLPVELTAFNARPTAKGIDLYWETASETDNYGFFVERKDISPGQESDWQQVAFVKGNGTTTSESRYNYSDTKLVSGHTYSYKLRQVDLDGAQSCYETMAVFATAPENADHSELTLINIAPNPVQVGDQISFTAYLPQECDLNWELVDIKGNSLIKGSFLGLMSGYQSLEINSTQLNSSEITSGYYLLRVTALGQSSTQAVRLIH